VGAGLDGDDKDALVVVLCLSDETVNVQLLLGDTFNAKPPWTPFTVKSEYLVSKTIRITPFCPRFQHKPKAGGGIPAHNHDGTAGTITRRPSTSGVCNSNNL